MSLFPFNGQILEGAILANVTLSATVFDNLVKQLAEIEDGKMEFLQEYFYKPSSERAEFEELMGDYIDKLDQLVRTAHKTVAHDNRVPFVTKDNEVEIQDLASQKPLYPS